MINPMVSKTPSPELYGLTDPKSRFSYLTIKQGLTYVSFTGTLATVPAILEAFST